MPAEPTRVPAVHQEEWSTVLRRLTEQRRDEPVSIEHYHRPSPALPLDDLPRDPVVGYAAFYAMQVVEHRDDKPEFVVLVRGEHLGELKQIIVRAMEHIGVGTGLVRIQSENGEGLEIRFLSAA